MQNHTSNLLSIFLLSLLDAVFTYIWLQNGIAEELNPLLAFCIDLGDAWFFSAKIALTGIGCLILFKTRESYWSRKSATALLFLYICLNIYHVVGAVFAISN